mmetsp:Transcript_22058/g.36143  ORF Transcript_22058/g.36143 Transcript_22058/m.36143 type:complete len:454 (+) Transcript_22058:84-1445(+)
MAKGRRQKDLPNTKRDQGKMNEEVDEAKKISQNSFWKALSILLLGILLAVAFQAYMQRLLLLGLRQRMEDIQWELHEYTKLGVRQGSADWIYQHTAEFARMRDDVEGTPKQTGYRLDESASNSMLDVGRWREFLAEHTPRAFSAPSDKANIRGEVEDSIGANTEGGESTLDDAVDCFNITHIALTNDDWASSKTNEAIDFARVLDPRARERARKALRECGFLVLDNLIRPGVIRKLRAAYSAFIASDRGKRYFKYPCQGEGRFEYMLPYESPFNDTDAPYNHPILRRVLLDFLNGPFKLELMTVINSKPGSGNQRWHQGWRYLFHAEEQLPPYSIVVGIPLANVTSQMGPTELCPRRKLRFYHGYRCDEGEVIRIGTTEGSVLLFDYKLLHRGPANRSPLFRPMISMVFSRMFFVNAEAYVNRGISLLQTLHQRRYWEEFVWHPDNAVQYFNV